MPTEVRCPKCRRIYLCPEKLELCLSSPSGRLPSLICSSCCGHGILPELPTKDVSKVPPDWKEGSHLLQQRGDKKIRLMNRLIREEGLTIEESFNRVINR